MGVLPPVVQKSARPRRWIAATSAAAIRSAASPAAASGSLVTTSSGSPLFGAGRADEIVPDRLSGAGEKSGSWSVIVLAPVPIGP